MPLDFSTRLSQASGLFRRFPDLPALVAERSFFLLGPRQTGKSTLSRASFPDALFLDLLDAQTCRSMVVAPNLIGERA